MARPLSEEKRNALLAAATSAVALAGPSASTAQIAKGAGVAEGTLFVYFESKDVLLNELFLSLKADMAAYVVRGLPSDADPARQIRHIWNRYIDWGAQGPERRSALRQLSVTERVSEASRQTAASYFDGIQAVFERSFAHGLLRQQPIGFLERILDAIAEVVQGAVKDAPEAAGLYRKLGWETLWGAITRADAPEN